jgi:hypothetical protein
MTSLTEVKLFVGGCKDKEWEARTIPATSRLNYDILHYASSTLRPIESYASEMPLDLRARSRIQHFSYYPHVYQNESVVYLIYALESMSAADVMAQLITSYAEFNRTPHGSTLQNQPAPDTISPNRRAAIERNDEYERAQAENKRAEDGSGGEGDDP